MRERFVPAILVQGILLHYLLSLYFPIVTIAGFTGPVVSVLDGDTIEVLHNTYPERVRHRLLVER